MTDEFVQARMVEAVKHLATSPDSLQERIHWAWRSMMIRVMPSDLPEDSRALFEQIEAKLSEKEAEDHTADVVEVNAHALDDKAAKQVAEAMFQLYERLR